MEWWLDQTKNEHFMILLDTLGIESDNFKFIKK